MTCTCDPTHGQSCAACDGTLAELIDEQQLTLTEPSLDLEAAA